MVSLSAGVRFPLQSIEELDAMLTRGRRHPFRPSGSDPHPFSEVAAFKIGTVAAIKSEMGPPSVEIYTADQRRRSSPAGWGGSSSHRSSSSSPVCRGLATKPWRRVATTRSKRHNSNLLVGTQSQKVSDQCSVSAVRPEPFDHSSAGVSSLIKARSPPLPEQFNSGFSRRILRYLMHGIERTSPICATAFPTNKPGSSLWNIS